MAKRNTSVNDRARQLVALEAARIIVEQGISDYFLAKTKAAERLGMTDFGSLPRNSEIEAAVADHLQLFGREQHSSLLQTLRKSALVAMEMLAQFRPRLVGPVLAGTASDNSPVNLHVFSDTPESVALTLEEQQVSFRPFDRRLKSRRDQAERFAAFRFLLGDHTVEATVFPVNGMRQAPISPIDGRPMKRANSKKVRAMLTAVDRLPDS